MSEPMERKVYTVQEFHWLEDENAALRARAEQAEGEVELIRKGAAAVWPENQFRLEHAEAERDALRAEVVGLSETLNDALSFTPPSAERWKAMERVVEAAQKWSKASIYDGAAIAELVGALAALDRTEER